MLKRNANTKINLPAQLDIFEYYMLYVPNIICELSETLYLNIVFCTQKVYWRLGMLMINGQTCLSVFVDLVKKTYLNKYISSNAGIKYRD